MKIIYKAVNNKPKAKTINHSPKKKRNKRTNTSPTEPNRANVTTAITNKPNPINSKVS
ncbi:hypothetical protein BTS2_0483 [Bacillus sp. TS-2]|nr:hypothetical protein BTS2_0483 [Bacillus sp. TS-2]